MKQTVTILTAMMVAMLLVSGFLVMGSMEQTEKLIGREEQLLKREKELEEKTLQVEKLEKEAQEQGEQMALIVKEREALSLQLNDAVLSSQESNDALAQQIQTIERLQMEKESLSKQLFNVRKELQTLRAQIGQASEQDVSTATLQQEPTPAPTVFRIERKVK